MPVSSTPLPRHAMLRPTSANAQLDDLAHRMAHLAGGQHEIIGLIRLQDLVHALDIVPGMSPVALGLEIAEYSVSSRPTSMRATPRVILRVTKRLATDRAFMIEQDTVRGMDAVALRGS